MNTKTVSIHYRFVARTYVIELRPVMDATVVGQPLFVGRAKSAASALRVAANALALCDREGWLLQKIEPFPWGTEAVRLPSANDSTVERPRRLAR